MRVAVGRHHLEDAVSDLEYGDVERSAAEVIDRDRLVRVLVESVGERGRRRLVYDAQHLQSRDPPRVLGRIALAVVEVGRDRDDRLGDRLAKVCLCVLLQLLEHHGRYLGWRVRIAGHLDVGVAVRVSNDFVRHQPDVTLHVRIVDPAAHETV